MSEELTDQVFEGTCYDVTGPVDAPTIALIHGLGLSRRLWDQHLPALSQHFRVINYDLYGHGDSLPLPESQTDHSANSAGDQPQNRATLKSYSQQLANLAIHLGCPRLAVVGFSIGGMINRRFAMDYADMVEALVIMNSPHNRGETLQAQVESRAAKVRGQGAMSTMPDALKRWFTPDFLTSSQISSQAPGNPEHSDVHGAELVTRWRHQVDAESYAEAAWVLANGVRELINPQPALDVPALVMTSENDSGSTPVMSRDIAAEIAQSELLIVPRLQHLGLMEEPTLFTDAIIEFLNRHWS